MLKNKNVRLFLGLFGVVILGYIVWNVRSIIYYFFAAAIIAFLARPLMTLLSKVKIKNWEIDHIDTIREDLEYIYYIWQKPECEAFISIFAGDYGNGEDFECIFVGNGQQLLNKYK